MGLETILALGGGIVSTTFLAWRDWRNGHYWAFQVDLVVASAFTIILLWNI